MQVVNLGDKITEEIKTKTSSDVVKKDEGKIKSVIDNITHETKDVLSGAKEFISKPSTKSLDEKEELFLVLCIGIVLGVVGGHLIK